MTTGHNADILQSLSDGQKTAGQSDPEPVPPAEPAPTDPSEPAADTETPDAALVPPVAPPDPPVAKVSPGRRGSAANS